MPPDQEKEDESPLTQINESDIEDIRRRLDSIDNKLLLFFQGNGRSKLVEIELNKELRKELEDKGIIEMVCENRRAIKDSKRLLYWVLGILSGLFISGFGSLTWLLLTHV